METAFRFQDFEIWQRSASVTTPLFEFAAEIETHKRFRWAEQLRGAVLSITNNIAEGSGSYSKAEFAQFLNYARRSIFETANILLQVSPDTPLPALPALLQELEEISRMIHSFRKSLL
jgi:four helix bundle protein